MPSSVRHVTNRLKAITKARWRPTSKSTTERTSSDKRRCFLLELPTELLLEIVSYLTVVPAACVALTCRRFFSIAGMTLGSESLRFNRDFARLFHHYRDRESFDTLRWEFLNLLEDNRWRICSRCLKLHPRNTFSLRELQRKPEARKCNLGDLAGIVDLCPCKKLTFRDKLDLVDHLHSRKKSMALMADPFYSNGASEPYCWHSCIVDYGSIEIRSDIFPMLDENDGLLIHTEYQLSTSPGQLGKAECMTPRFGCPHRSIDLWLSSVCQTTICQIQEPFCLACSRIMACSYCDTALRFSQGRPRYTGDSDKMTYCFQTQRYLGEATPEPSKAWAAQRVHPAGPFSGLHTSNELCPWALRGHPPLDWPPSLNTQIVYPAINDDSMSQLYQYSIHMM